MRSSGLGATGTGPTWKVVAGIRPQVTGLRAPGGFEVDLIWRHGALERATIRSLLGRPLRVRRGNTLRNVDTRRGATLTLIGDELRAGTRLSGSRE